MWRRGKLVRLAVDWPLAWRGASRLAQTHAATVGCRSLDILHGALAEALRATRFVSSDTRQLALARLTALRVLAI